jgi:hypothetical protein
MSHLLVRAFDIVLMTGIITRTRTLMGDYAPLAAKPTVNDAPYT